jgi:hypothetical protein
VKYIGTKFCPEIYKGRNDLRDPAFDGIIMWVYINIFFFLRRRLNARQSHNIKMANRPLENVWERKK